MVLLLEAVVGMDEADTARVGEALGQAFAKIGVMGRRSHLRVFSYKSRIRSFI